MTRRQFWVGLLLLSLAGIGSRLAFPSELKQVTLLVEGMT